MTPPRWFERLLILRRPPLAFAALGLALATATALVLAIWASSGFVAFYSEAAPALAIPALFGAGIAVVRFNTRLSGGRPIAVLGLISGAALSFAIAGLVWPLSFALAILLQGDFAGALGHMPPAAAGLLVGAIGGALGGALAAFAAFKTAA